jgi:hypothetical protein
MLLTCVKTQAQFSATTNFRVKRISTKNNVTLDTLSIIPNSFLLKNIDTNFYTINLITATIYWKKKLQLDSVTVSYRVFPYNFNKTYKRFNYDSIKNNFIAAQPFIFNNSISNYNDNNAAFLDFGKINYSGSFGRNLSFGNNQDAVFNSQLNLQLNGIIGDSIELAAAITDNNIPIQPDGTTQRLNEFDKILLQFKKKNWQLSLGDLDLRQNQNYFLNFYKRLQGASYQQEKKNGNLTKNKFLLAGAIAKGKFTRNVFNGQEGNQGPYRLQGANSETYFIVLAGTERVFIDGELLNRGEDQDYVINYNTAELTFTPKRMITKDRRIQIEFEYAERSYLNSMFYVSNEAQVSPNLKINIAAYTNADAKNSPINQQLDNKQKQFLADIGNNNQAAFYPYESIDSFSTTKILYAKRPSPISVSDSIYVYSTNKDSAKYNLVFSEVGPNKGNYIPLFNGSNGKVYQWIAPVNNLPQGNFEPAQFLVTPKKQQIITIGTEYYINNKTTLKSDIAMSNYDVNTFSTINKNDNKGFAGKFVLQHNSKLNRSLQFNTSFNYEWAEQNFKPLERLRSVEFSRDWGLPIITTTATEYLPKASFEIKDNQNNSFLYTTEAYIRSDNYKGYKQTLQHIHTLKDWNLKTNISYTNNDALISKGYFFRPTFELSKQLKQFNKYIIGVGYAMEDNQQRYKSTDTMVLTSFSFETISAFIKSNQQKNNKWGFTYFTRADKLPSQKQLEQIDRSHNYNLTADFLNNPKHLIRLNITFRELNVTNQTLTTIKPDNSLLGRLEYNINEWKGFVTGFVLYELGAGQEQRRDFSYLEVQAGRGQYAWNDYNADGIPQLNEFEIAQFPDQAKYIKIFTPTNQYIKANYNQFNYSLNINPRAIAATIKNKRFKNFITRFNLQSSQQRSKKVLSDGNLHFNPFEKNINDTALINLINTFSNTLSINRASSSWGIDISNINNNNKALLTYGLESRQIEDFIVKGRFNLKREYTVELIQKWGTSELTTPQFNNRNYNITSIQTEPKFTYTNSTKYRLQVSYQYLKKSNLQAFGGEQSVANSLNLEGKYNSAKGNVISAKFTSTNITFAGTQNTTVSYIMLDGLLPGKNYLWNIEFTKRLNNNFEISFNYEGRKPGESRVINIGRASVRAIL